MPRVFYGPTCLCGTPCPCSPCCRSDCSYSAQRVCQLCGKQIDLKLGENSCTCFLMDTQLEEPETSVAQHGSNTYSSTAPKRPRIKVSKKASVQVKKDSGTQKRNDSSVQDIPVQAEKVHNAKVRTVSRTNNTDSCSRKKDVARVPARFFSSVQAMRLSIDYVETDSFTDEMVARTVSKANVKTNSCFQTKDGVSAKAKVDSSVHANKFSKTNTNSAFLTYSEALSKTTSGSSAKVDSSVQVKRFSKDNENTNSSSLIYSNSDALSKALSSSTTKVDSGVKVEVQLGTQEGVNPNVLAETKVHSGVEVEEQLGTQEGVNPSVLAETKVDSGVEVEVQLGTQEGENPNVLAETKVDSGVEVEEQLGTQEGVNPSVLAEMQWIVPSWGDYSQICHTCWRGGSNFFTQCHECFQRTSYCTNTAEHVLPPNDIATNYTSDSIPITSVSQPINEAFQPNDIESYYQSLDEDESKDDFIIEWLEKTRIHPNGNV